MRFRLLAFALSSASIASIAFAATPPPKTPASTSSKTLAPATIAHPMAMFLGELSHGGKEKVTFRASALGTHFFFEEPTGVTVYVYDETVGYRKETFLKGFTLARVVKKYK